MRSACGVGNSEGQRFFASRNHALTPFCFGLLGDSWVEEVDSWGLASW